MRKLITAICERMHRTCTELICAQHDAVVDGAEAHHEAVQELAAERALNSRLTADNNAMATSNYRLDEELSKADETIQDLEEALAAEQARAAQAEASRAAVEKLLAEPLPLTRPHLEHQQSVDAALFNICLMRILLRDEGNRHVDSFYGEYVHQLADALQARIVAVHAVLKGDHDPERDLALLRAPLDAVPAPREEVAV